MKGEHTYSAQVIWTGNRGSGTSSYRAYDRTHEIRSPGKPAIAGSSDPSFRGDAARYNPEDLLVASLSACHMLSYLHVCAVAGISVVDYEDDATGRMVETAEGGGRFTGVLLQPRVTIAAGCDERVALELHERAHHLCFIAASVNFPVECRAVVQTAADSPASRSGSGATGAAVEPSAPRPSWHEERRWDALVDGTACPMCAGSGPAHMVAELEASVVTVSPDVQVRGYCCVIPREHAIELHALSAEAAHGFMRDVRRAAQAVQALTGATKLNYEVHGNVVPHVHMHIIPRYPGDAIERTGRGFAIQKESVYAEGEREAYTVRLRELLQ